MFAAAPCREGATGPRDGAIAMLGGRPTVSGIAAEYAPGPGPAACIWACTCAAWDGRLAAATDGRAAETFWFEWTVALVAGAPLGALDA